MKAFDITQVCPYTGLRSFTEEESLYFKGRDLQVDQIIALLEQNKFLMVTGASGEGKSSLIYAGLIPNARAGFFKARYTNWVVADFRPERNPVVNMAKSLAEKFESQPSTVETELRRGFSSLVDLYTNSEFYTDEQDEKWKQLPEQDKKEKKRKASNLMIIVDQFEEFFTNPENFYNESPSQDSQVLVNLVLETARLAIQKNLPIYVVCTMRSDYIGQCSAFRGLPEYIGFSQFFVPRLKRKDLKQVIEEPAILSGNRISQRLIERLVFDIAEGVDQLPILQHALSQVWLAATHGQEEMDLIHYAMVGGMPANELPDEDQSRFQNWFARLPEHQQSYYKETGLGKVIEIHASILYENAWTSYNATHADRLITQQEAKRTIALAFSCLTKIDNSRAVRNRMTLGEITAIINSSQFSTATVGEILDIYREDGNSFVRPFITDDPSTKELSPDTVLDITHESLIRNWNKLNAWANQEFEFYATYLDFRKQLNRWKQSGKSSGYLLPIGPLTYFENWYTECKPNTGWIKRYSEIQPDAALARKEAEEVLIDMREFLKRSARNVAITRAFMKYGPKRIATTAAIVIMLVLSAFYWYDAEQKTNERVIDRVRKEALELVGSKEVDDQSKATHLIMEERYMPGSLITNLSNLNYDNQLRLSIEAYKLLQYFDKNHEGELKTQLQDLIARNLKSPPAIAPKDFLVTQGNKFIVLLLRDDYYNSNTRKASLLKELTNIMREQVLSFYRDRKLHRPAVPAELNMGLQLWLTAGDVSPEKVQELIAAISPLADSEAEKSFDIYYPKGSLEPNGRQPIDYNGGFHTLASLYAAVGEYENLEWCFNRLIETNQRAYFELGRLFNNHLNILGYLYQYNHQELVPEFLKWVTTHTQDNPAITVYRNTIIRGGYISDLYMGGNVDKDFFRSYRGYIHPNLYLANRTVFEAIATDYEKVINEIKNPDERNFQLAMQYKRKAMFMHKYWYDRKMTIDENKLNDWLKSSLDYYSRIDPEYLSGKVSSTTPYYWDGVRTADVKMNDLYIYPDYRDGWFSLTYHSDYFYNYLSKNGLLGRIYKTGNDLQAIHFWIAKAFEVKPFPAPLTLDNDYPMKDETLIDVISFVDQHPEGKAFDKNLLVLVLANNAFARGDIQQGMAYYQRVDQANISRAYDRYEYIEKTFFLNMMNQLCIHLADIGKAKEGVQFVELFSKEEEKMFSYLFMANQVYEKNADPIAFVYLDSALSKSRKVDYTILPITTDPWMDPRHNAVRLLSRIGSKDINQLAVEMLKDVEEEIKFNTILSRVVGVTMEGNFYRARTSIPNTLTESQDLQCRSMILLKACEKKEKQDAMNEWKAMDRFFDWQWSYVFYFAS